ncbi:Oxygen-independent coproporphyrinogen-III oxidase-like protein [bioreactor metagenome]|uniref:Oxygen-independent coproporphyrinogen-III oxidase-like protein n=1 Tax=bioreactor metagenome TaxID=1076179 RepID=A0A644Y035_9ZZZZ
MSHLYIHIPFCHSKCPYCDFFSVATKKWHSEFVQALCGEVVMRHGEISGALKTIYFGGGTPSLLSEQDLERIISEIRKNFSIESDAEITLEANPDDITPEKLYFWQSVGVNRLSIGIQSLNDEELKFLGRRHNAARSRTALYDAIEAGFDNISVDLIHGVPGSDPENTFKAIEEFSQNGVKHLSMYSLTIEKGTILENRIRKGILNNTDEDFQASVYEKAVEKAEEFGFKQYEISNSCVPGFESQHNSAYWKGAPYLGLGPSAHSFDGKSRRWNVADIQQYINGINDQKPVYESEILSKTDKYNEFLLTRLRLIHGIDFFEMEQLFGKQSVENIIHEIEKLNSPQYFHTTEKSLALTRSGLLFADRIISELMK